MALTTVYGQDAIKAVASVTLSSSYLGAGNYVTIQRARKADLWCDDSSIALTYKFSYDGGTTFTPDMPLGAGSVYTAEPPLGRTLTIDVKSASGTPKLGVLVY